MSRNNITSIVPNGMKSVVVTFRLKDGGSRSYEFEGFAAAAVLAGGDPKDYPGREVSTRFGGDVLSAEALAELAAEIVIEI